MALIHPETTWSPVGHEELMSWKFRRSLPAEETCRPRLIGALRALAVSRPPVRRSCAQELKVPRGRIRCSEKVKVS